MTASEFAGLMHARRVGKGRWIAICPSHGDRHPSLSIDEGKKGGQYTMVICCRSHGCDGRDILKSVGLSWRDFRVGGRSPVSHEIRQRMTQQDHWDSLQRQLGLVICLGAIENGKRAYWSAAERRIRGEIDQLRCVLEPERVIREWRERMFQQRVRKYGWEMLWMEVK